jgi:hypothetical protein
MSLLPLLRSGMLALLVAAPVVAAEEAPAPAAKPGTAPGSAQAAAEPNAALLPAPVYTPPAATTGRPFEPPRRGKPRGRVGGGSRGPGSAEVVALLALVPEHVARSASPQPSLFWYVDALPAPGAKFLFTLIDEKSTAPLKEVALAAPERPGVQRIRLGDLGIELASGLQYEWSVSIVRDPAARSTDIVASGWIDRVEPPASLARELDGASAQAAVDVYARNGLWYDAMTRLCDLIDEHPEDAALRRSRDALLGQVGLQASPDTPF